MVCAAVIAAMVPVTALADDPRDPAMRSAAARARDAEMTRQLNLQQAAMVRARDARYAQGWQTPGSDGSYAAARARYERDLAQWRQAVAACRAGDTAACAR